MDFIRFFQIIDQIKPIRFRSGREIATHQKFRWDSHSADKLYVSSKRDVTVTSYNTCQYDGAALQSNPRSISPIPDSGFDSDFRV